MHHETYGDDVMELVPGDIAVHDACDAPGLDEGTAVPYAIVARHVGDLQLLATDGTLCCMSPYEMARSADWYPCLLGCARVHPRVHGA